MPVNPNFTAITTAPYSRESAAKGDDQIAYENAVSCEEVGRHQSALEWYAEVKPTGNRWDRAASMRRVALLVALNRSEEAVDLGIKAVMRMNRSSPGLIAEVARAWNQHIGPSRALDFCRHWLSHTHPTDAGLPRHGGRIKSDAFQIYEAEVKPPMPITRLTVQVHDGDDAERVIINPADTAYGNRFMRALRASRSNFRLICGRALIWAMATSASAMKLRPSSSSTPP